jgi:hypothetical protein
MITLDNKLEVSTGLLGIINICSYWGDFNTEFTIDDHSIRDDFDEGFINYTNNEFWEHFDYAAYNKHILQSAASFFDEQMVDVFKDLEIGITGGKVVGIDSPKYYNHRGDHLNFDLEVSSDYKVLLLEKLKEADQEKLAKFLKDNYSSYDGFMSFTPNTIEGVVEGFEEDNIQSICAGIMFLLWDEHGKEDSYQFDTDWQMDLYETFSQDFHYGNFITDEFLETISERDNIIPIIQKEYDKKTREELIQMVLDMWYEDNIYESLEMNNATIIVNNAIKNIESNNHKLDFPE